MAYIILMNVLYAKNDGGGNQNLNKNGYSNYLYQLIHKQTMKEETQHLLTEAIKKYCKDNGKKYPGYASIAFEAGVNWGISNPIPTTQKEGAKTVEGNQYKETVSWDELWQWHLNLSKSHSELDVLVENLAEQNTALMEENERMREVLESFVNDHTLGYTVMTDFMISQANDALKPTP